MSYFKKSSSKILSLIISIVFCINTSVYGLDIYAKSHLRPRLIFHKRNLKQDPTIAPKKPLLAKGEKPTLDREKYTKMLELWKKAPTLSGISLHATYSIGSQAISEKRSVSIHQLKMDDSFKLSLEPIFKNIRTIN